MKTLLLSIALSFSAYFLSAQSDSEPTNEGTTITVIVPIPSDEGNVLFGLYEETNFMQNPTIGLIGEIVDGKAMVTFANISPGTYAITLFHDKNLNKIMDVDMNGMPLEMYGASNNVLSMGPPQWSDAKFEVANVPIQMEIRM